MASVVQKNFRIRNSFGQIEQVIDIPNLIDIQKQSYVQFLQMNVPADERIEVGLQGVFKSVFPIKDFNETCSLEFVSYLERPKYDVLECTQRGMTFAARSRWSFAWLFGTRAKRTQCLRFAIMKEQVYWRNSAADRRGDVHRERN